MIDKRKERERKENADSQIFLKKKKFILFILFEKCWSPTPQFSPWFFLCINLKDGTFYLRFSLISSNEKKPLVSPV